MSIWLRRTYHDSIPSVSSLVAAQQRHTVHSIKQNDIFAVSQLNRELDLMGGKLGNLLEFPWRMDSKFPYEANPLIQVRAEDESEQDCLVDVSLDPKFKLNEGLLYF